MARPALRLASRVLASAVASFAVLSGAALALPRGGAAQARPRAARPARLACTTVIVGRGATADGSVLLGHNEDLGDAAVQRYVSVPRRTHRPGETLTLWSGARLAQVAETLAYVATTVFDVAHVPGDLTGGINERQVAVANDLAYQRDVAEPYPVRDRVLWSDFMRVILERAHDAREAVATIGRLAEEHRLGGDPGTVFGVTDPREGWWVEVGPDGIWAAARVADDAVEVRANAWRIGALDFGDGDHFRAAAGLVEHAVRRGWYAPGSGPFRFAGACGDAETDGAWNTDRERRALRLLAPHAPRITPAHVMSVLRDHGAPAAPDDAAPRGASPHHATGERYTLCNLDTEVSVVCQSRSGLPPRVGAVAWRALGPPCSSAYVPWYLGHEVPEPYARGSLAREPGSAYWTFRDLATAVDGQFPARSPRVRASFEVLEAAQAALQPALEAEALAALRAGNAAEATDLLSRHSGAHALAAQECAAALLEVLGGRRR